LLPKTPLQLAGSTVSLIAGTDNPKRLDDRIVVITGGNSGIGEETTYDLARSDPQLQGILKGEVSLYS
jgi:hypothetical protein